MLFVEPLFDLKGIEFGAEYVRQSFFEGLLSAMPSFAFAHADIALKFFPLFLE